MIKHNLNQLDLQTALAYDRIELNRQTFEVEDRWAINTERSLLLQNNRYDERKSFLSPCLLNKIKSILRQVELKNWEEPDLFSVEI